MVHVFRFEAPAHWPTSGVPVEYEWSATGVLLIVHGVYLNVGGVNGWTFTPQQSLSARAPFCICRTPLSDFEGGVWFFHLSRCGVPVQWSMLVEYASGVC